ncbi:MAG: WecB/TagA/CpsF family glycosyltransferase [bacterium]
MSNKPGCIIGTIIAAAGIVSGAVLLRRLRNLPVATERVELLDVPVDPVTMEEALRRIDAFIISGKPHHIVTADASGIMRALETPEFGDIVRRADLVTADGAGVLLATKLCGQRMPERVSGCDLVVHICALAAEKGYPVYLFGAGEDIARQAADKLVSRHPGLQIAGTRNGFFTPEDEPKIALEIAASGARVIFVALGIPKQELFIRKYFDELNVPVLIGVGGSFDVISGNLKRAPRWMQVTGIEWLYRLAQEPKRLPRMAALPRFIVAVWRSRKR